MFRLIKNLSKSSSEEFNMKENKNFDLITIVGPTASGKTALAIELAKAFSGEIISADSMQIYKEFSILSAKPSNEELAQAKHHLMGFVPASQQYSAAEFIRDAEKALKEIKARGNIPIMVGGTGLYIDSFLKGIDFSGEKAIDSEKRVELTKHSNETLMKMLSEIDKKSADKIHLNDTKRLIRAIEFFYSEGYPISEHDENSKLVPAKYKAIKLGLNFRSRDILYERINKRVDLMLEKGIVDEVRAASRLVVGKTASSAIGYKEILPYINHECTLDEAKENLKQATRRYAKRQLTWFRRDKEIKWIYIDDFENFDEISELAKNLIINFK